MNFIEVIIYLAQKLYLKILNYVYEMLRAWSIFYRNIIPYYKFN